MVDIIVGVRMPRKLLLAIRAITEKRNFLDTSEAVRSIVRQHWQEATRPEIRKKSAIREIRDVERRRLLEKIRKLSEELKELGEENEG